MITAKHIEQYHTQGYCTVPDFWSKEEVEALLLGMEDLKARGLIGNVATDGDGKTSSNAKLNLQVCPIFDKSDIFRAAPFHPKVIAATRALIGDPVVFKLDQIFLKPARNGAGTSWHQDNTYFKIKDATRSVGMWTALHAATVANGTMHVVPGIYKDLLPHERDPLSNHHVRCYPDESKAIPVELPQGGVLFFNFNVPHCTLGNGTDKDRAGLALHFFNQDAYEGDLWDSMWPHCVLTGPDATGGLRERGVKVEGTWEAEMEKMLAAGARR